MIGIGRFRSRMAAWRLAGGLEPSASRARTPDPLRLALVSNGETHLPRCLPLGGVDGQESVERLCLMKCERSTEMGEIERPRCRHGGHRVGLTQPQGQVVKCEQFRVEIHPVEALSELRLGECSLPCQPHQISLRFQNQKNIRDELGPFGLANEVLPSFLCQKDAEVRRRVEVDPSLTQGVDGAQRPPRSSSRTARYRPFVPRRIAGARSPCPILDPRRTCACAGGPSCATV